MGHPAVNSNSLCTRTCTLRSYTQSWKWCQWIDSVSMESFFYYITPPPRSITVQQKTQRHIPYSSTQYSTQTKLPLSEVPSCKNKFGEAQMEYCMEYCTNTDWNTDIYLGNSCFNMICILMMQLPCLFLFYHLLNMSVIVHVRTCIYILHHGYLQHTVTRQ